MDAIGKLSPNSQRQDWQTGITRSWPGCSVDKNYTAPTTDLEKQLATIWEQLLKKDRVGIHDNFFELGGHSLLAMRLVSVIRNALTIEIAIKELFIHPTIALLAKNIAAKTNSANFQQ